MNARGTGAALSWPAQIAPLTTLRFFAAMMVVLLHYRERAGLPALAGSALFTRGYLAVDFFFILSGFVLAHVYMEKVRAGTCSHVAFVERRLARIWPMHLAMLAMVIVLYGAMLAAGLEPNNPARYDMALLPAHILMLHAWGIPDAALGFNYPSWSVSAEWFAYLLFPLFAAPLLRLWNRPALFAALAMASFAAFYAAAPAIFGARLTELTDDGIWRIAPEFLLGMALWRLGLSGGLDPRLTPLHLFLAFLSVVLLAALGAGDAFFIPAFAWLIFSAAEAARRKTPSLAWLSARPLVYLGEISYALYMAHALVFTVWFNGIDTVLGREFSQTWRPAIWAGGILISVVAAAAAHHLIELPGKGLILRTAPLRRLQQRLRPGGERRRG